MKRALAATAVVLAFAACTYDFDEDYARCHESGWCAQQADGGMDGGGVSITALAAPAVFGDTRVGGRLTFDGGSFDAGDGVDVAVNVELQRCAGPDASVCGTVPLTGGAYLISSADLDGRFRAVATATADGGSASASSELTTPVYRVDPARLVALTGFETGDVLSVTRPWTNVAVTKGATGLSPRTGDYMLRLQGVGSGAQVEDPALQVTTAIIGRFALNLNALPSANQFVDVTELVSGAAVDPVFSIDEQGRILGGDGPFGARAQGPQLARGRWHVIDFQIRVATGATAFGLDWRVDGAEQPSGTVTRPQTLLDGGAVGPPTALALGMVQDGAFTAFVDDFAVSTLPGDYPIGDGRVIALAPTALARVSRDAGFYCYDPSGFCGGAGIPVTLGTNGAAQAVSQRPSDSSGYVVQVADGAQEFLSFTLGPAPTFDGIVNTASLKASFSSQSQVTVGTRLHHGDGGTYLQSNSGINGPGLVKLVTQRDVDGTSYALSDFAGNELSFGYCSAAANGLPELREVLVELDVAAPVTR